MNVAVYIGYSGSLHLFRKFKSEVVCFLDGNNVNLMFTHKTTQIIAFWGQYAFDVEVADFQIQSNFLECWVQAIFIHFQAVLRRQLLVLITIGRANGLAANFLK
jgi:hypothetical protein